MIRSQLEVDIASSDQVSETSLLRFIIDQKSSKNGVFVKTFKYRKKWIIKLLLTSNVVEVEPSLWTIKGKDLVLGHQEMHVMVKNIDPSTGGSRINIRFEAPDPKYSWDAFFLLPPIRMQKVESAANHYDINTQTCVVGSSVGMG